VAYTPGGEGATITHDLEGDSLMDTPTEASNRDERASRLRTAAAGAGIGIAALVGVGAATAAFAGAQADDDPPSSISPEESTSPAESATPDDTGTPDDGPRAGHGEHLAEALAPLVADGTLTQEQADAVVARLKEAGAEAREKWGERGPRRGIRGGLGNGEVSALLGLTPDELREQLKGDATLPDLAADAGVTPEALVDAMLSPMREHLAERVADGDITQEVADERLAQATEWATAVANGERPSRPERPGAPGE
jgi:hypothetical protein